MIKMSVKAFLIDRILYIAAYTLNVVFMLLIVQLGLLENGAPLSFENVLYLLLLSAVGLTLLLLIDYGRQRSFYKRMNRFLQNGTDRDGVPLLQGARTREQNAFRDIVERQYRHYTERLMEYRERQKQHVHFIHQWVHQMKTPVSVIDLLVQKIKETEANTGHQSTLDSIGEETDKLVHGLEMMLHTARLDDFALDLKAERADIVHILREIVHEHKRACIRDSVFPKMQTEQEETVVQTDVKWIRFVFNQLITNAIKYSRYQPGSKTLWIYVYEDDTGWHVSIKDEGVGIPQQDLKRIFDPFFTGENGRTFPESTGMGLYLAKQVCDRLDHRLHVQSQEGEGTTVTVTFRKNRHLHEL